MWIYLCNVMFCKNIHIYIHNIIHIFLAGFQRNENISQLKWTLRVTQMLQYECCLDRWGNEEFWRLEKCSWHAVSQYQLTRWKNLSKTSILFVGAWFQLVKPKPSKTITQRDRHRQHRSIISTNRQSMGHHLKCKDSWAGKETHQGHHTTDGTKNK